VTAEAPQIAARPASSPWFPLVATATVKERALIAHAQADGNVVTITVTNAAASGKRVYRARVELVSRQCRYCTVPVDSDDICTFCASYTPPETAAARSPAEVLP
jgi:hypothetical protein